MLRKLQRFENKLSITSPNHLRRREIKSRPDSDPIKMPHIAKRSQLFAAKPTQIPSKNPMTTASINIVSASIRSRGAEVSLATLSTMFSTMFSVSFTEAISC